MATRRIVGPESEGETVIPEREPVTIEGAFDDITDILAQDHEAFTNILAELGESESETRFKMKAYRVLKDKGRNAWLFDFQPSELPILDRLRDEYGGGTFEIRVHAGPKLIKRSTIDVEAPSRLPPIQPRNDSTAEMMKLLLEEMRARNASPLPPSRGLDINGLAALLTAAAPLVTGAIGGIAKLARPAPTPAPSDNLGTMLEVLQRGMEMGRIANDGGSDREENLFGMLKTAINQFGPPMADAYKRMTENPTPQPVAPQFQHVPALGAQPMPQPAPQPAPTSPEMDNAMNFLQMQLRMLVQQAQHQKDPYPYALMILDNAPADKVQQFIINPDWFTELQRLVPEVAMYPAWFGELRDTILAELQADGDDGETSDPAAPMQSAPDLTSGGAPVNTSGQMSSERPQDAGGRPQETDSETGQGHAPMDS